MIPTTLASVRLTQVRFTENKGEKTWAYCGWCPLGAGCPLNMGPALM